MVHAQFLVTTIVLRTPCH